MSGSGCRVGVIVAMFIASSAMGQQRGAVVFEDDFEKALRPEWSYKTVSSAPKGKHRFLGPIGAESISLKLTQLPRHRHLRLKFDLHALISWDGSEGGHGPDVLVVQSGDGRTLFATTFGIFSIQSFPGWYGVHANIPYSGATAKNSLGYTFNGEPRDGTYPIEIVFPHSDDALTLRFMMYGDGLIVDEAWGLDNVTISVEEVPPATNEQMERSWQALAGDDAAAAAKAVYELACGQAEAVSFLEAKLRGKTLPFEPPLLQASAFRLRPRAMDSPVTLGIRDPAERQLALAAHALSITDVAAARLVLQSLLPEPRDFEASTITVRNTRSREPVPHQPIRFMSQNDPQRYPLFTNDRGEVTLKLPGEQNSISYSTPRRKYVPVYQSVELQGGAGVPTEILIEPGVPIGGQVLGPDNTPVAGATVKLEINGMPSPYLWDPWTTTDGEGRWTFDLAPQRLMGVSVAAFHPQYAAASSHVLSLRPFERMAELQRGEARVFLNRGTPIEGVVRDSQGKPIPDAWVEWGTPRGPYDGIIPAQTTDAQGRFRYTGLPGQSPLLTAKAAGFAMQQKSVALGQAPAPVEFTLQPSKTAFGKVVTPAGEPIFGARVFLGRIGTGQMFDMSLSTDRNGAFSWESAPDEPVSGSVTAPGYPSQPVTLLAGQETIVQLQGPIVIKGRVVDAETNQPVAGTRASYGILRSGSMSTFQPGGGDAGNGTFEIRISAASVEGVVIRVEADGYLPTNSELIQNDGTVKQLELKLFSTR